MGTEKLVQRDCWTEKKSPCTQAVAKTIGCSQQNSSKGPSLKSTFTELNEHGGVELKPT